MESRGLVQHKSAEVVHQESFPKRGFIRMSGKDLFLLVTVLKDDGVNDFTTKNASPSEKFFRISVEFFIIHDPTAFLTLHLLFSPFYQI